MISRSAMRLTSSTSGSRTVALTISRREDRQCWPLAVKADWTISAAALAISAVSQAMSGLLPPISSASNLPGRVAQLAAMAMPERDEPVNRTPFTASSMISALAASGPPMTHWTRSSMTPAS